MIVSAAVLASSATVPEQRLAAQANASSEKAFELERVLALLDDAEQVCMLSLRDDGSG